MFIYFGFALLPSYGLIRGEHSKPFPLPHFTKPLYFQEVQSLLTTGSPPAPQH